MAMPTRQLWSWTETRQCLVLSSPDYLRHLHRDAHWQNLQTVVRIHTDQQINGKWSRQVRYYISNLDNDPHLILKIVRDNWQIENGMHWVLNIAFREDDNLVRKDHAPENFALVRHFARNLLKQETTLRVAIKSKRFRAACDRDYLLQVLSLG